MWDSSTKIRWWDLPIGLVLGLLWTLLCCDWLAHFHTDVNGIFYADLIEYCNGVSTPSLIGIGASNKRSAFAMLLPRYFTQSVGVFDGLALGAVWGQIGIGALFYWWGILIGGRRMGISVLLLACVAAPITFISRILSSYPAMSLCFVAGATGTMGGIKSRRTFPMFLAGIGLSMTLLADTRGIVWALPWMGGLLGSIALRGTLWNKSLRTLALCIPLYISHIYASNFYVFDAIGLEAQVDIRPSLYHWLRIYPPPYEYTSNYTWGMAPLTDLPKTLLFLWEQTKLVVPPSERDAGLVLGRAIAKFYWDWAVLGMGVTAICFIKKPWRLIAVVISVTPFVMTFHGALTMLEEHIRFYIQTLPGIVILWAILWEQGVGLFDHIVIWITDSWYPFFQRLTRIALCWILPIYILLNLILGSIESPLSPSANWRRNWDPQPSDFGDLISNYTDGRMMKLNSIEPCGRGIQKVEAMHKPLETTIYNNGLREQLDIVIESAIQPIMKNK